MYYYIGIEQFKGDIAPDNKYIDLLVGGCKSVRVYLSKQKTGYGYKNFMVCPVCGTRHVKLYLYNQKLICRNCYPDNIYDGIQHPVKGGNKSIAYRMCRYAISHGITIKRFPFNYMDYESERPKGRKESSWVDSLIVLQALENMRYQSHAYHKEWSNKTIKSILTWNNLLMYLFNLSEMQDMKNLIKWDNGVGMDLLLN